MLDQAEHYPAVKEYLPDERDLPRLSRVWIGNLFMSIVGKPFADWIDETIEERNNKLATSNNLNIDISPELYEIFKNSTAISSKLAFHYKNLYY